MGILIGPTGVILDGLPCCNGPEIRAGLRPVRGIVRRHRDASVNGSIYFLTQAQGRLNS